MTVLFRLAIALLLVVLAIGASAVELDQKSGTIWAVLVAGSYTYDNYRHQADVCHAYQVFRRHGIPDSQIIVMMYDDIALNDENPKKGRIFNKPGGKNVYKNILKDYTKKTVNPKNFLHVITGNSTAMKGIGSGKVLASGPNDHVFINFVDHGATGMVAFPDDYLYADELIRALKKMYKNKMFKRLVFYMEACEAGSMFHNLLPSNIEVYAATASNPDESSYACYCDDLRFDTCLGDEFSVAWMEDIDSEDKAGNLTSETLLKQYKTVVSLVSDSHPKIYGETSKMESEVVTDFFGSENSSSTLNAKKFKEQLQGVVSSREVAMHNLNKKIERLSGDAKTKAQTERNTLIKGRRTVDTLFSRIMKGVSTVKGYKVEDMENSRTELSMDMMSCYKTLVDNFHKSCVNINKNTYAMIHLYKFANLCAQEDFSTHYLLDIFARACTEGHRALTKIN